MTRGPVLFLALAFAAPAFGQDRTPDALARHFQRGDYNCYTLADPVPGLTVDLRHHFDPQRDTIGYYGAQLYDIDLLAGPSEDPIWVLGQCKTGGGQIGCGVGCDSGQFQIKDAGIEDILLVIERLGEECPDGATRTFDRARYGQVFILSREPDSTCEEHFRTDQ